MTKKQETKEVFVAIKNLSVVWRQAQRKFREAWAKEIAEDFDPDKFDPPVITKPNGEGKYHIVEGQHRVWAAKANYGDEEQLKCRQVDADEPARAAEIFLGINSGRKAVKPVTKFLVAVVANRVDEVAINRLVNKIGYKVTETKGDYCISAVSSMVYVYQRQGISVLQDALLTLDKTWPGDHAAFQGELIKGYAVFINEFPNVDRTRVAEVIVKAPFSPNTLIAAARLYRDQHRTSMTEAMSEILRAKYNRNCREDRKLRKK
jgi:hypothetical protein